MPSLVIFVLGAVLLVPDNGWLNDMVGWGVAEVSWLYIFFDSCCVSAAKLASNLLARGFLRRRHARRWMIAAVVFSRGGSRNVEVGEVAELADMGCGGTQAVGLGSRR